jgi:hypothetical protein
MPPVGTTSVCLQSQILAKQNHSIGYPHQIIEGSNLLTWDLGTTELVQPHLVPLRQQLSLLSFADGSEAITMKIHSVNSVKGHARLILPCTLGLQELLLSLLVEEVTEWQDLGPFPQDTLHQQLIFLARALHIQKIAQPYTSGTGTIETVRIDVVMLINFSSNSKTG